jgi:roadblock/LC7 domain-containing protein
VTRIPSLTSQEAPGASRTMLEGVVQFSPTGKLLNLHAQMAHSPAVLAAYFLGYAQTPLDLPADPAGAEG